MTQKRQVIAQFFKEIKKVKRGEVVQPAPQPEKKKATMPEKLGNPKVQEWLRKNNRGR